VQPIGASINSEQLDVHQLRIQDPALARQLRTQWSWRGVTDLTLQPGGRTSILGRTQGTFAALKDADAGFDLELLANARTAGLTPILRINFDPWLADASWLKWLADLPTAPAPTGVLFN